MERRAHATIGGHSCHPSSSCGPVMVRDLPRFALQGGMRKEADPGSVTRGWGVGPSRAGAWLSAWRGWTPWGQHLIVRMGGSGVSEAGNVGVPGPPSTQLRLSRSPASPPNRSTRRRGHLRARGGQSMCFSTPETY